MSKKTGICLICLHTDRYLKNIDTKLSDFHFELCGSAVHNNPRYCSQCEYLLRKAYKFREKCLTAMDILKTWNRSKGVDKKPITDLCTLLPETLNVRMSDDALIYSFTGEEATPAHAIMMTVEPRVELEQKSGADGAEDIVESRKLENSLPKDIKVETNKMETCITEDNSIKYLKDFLIVKNEDATNTFEEILFESNGNIETENDDKCNFDENNETQSDVVNDVIKDLSISNNSEDKIIYLKDDDKSDLENESNKQSDAMNDISNDFGVSDDDDDKLIYLKNRLLKNKQNLNKYTRKRCLENDNHSENGKISKKIIIVMKKENYANKRSVVKKNKDSKRNVAKMIVEKDSTKRIRFHSRKAIVAEVMNKDFKMNDENVEQNMKNCKKRPFTKERLQEEVRSKFASCGELRAADGTLIDKEFVLECLEDKVTEYVMKQLYQAVYRKSRFKPKALKLFKCIQNKYRNEYDSVFDIEYLNTKEKMIEEFEKRPTYESYVTAEFKCEICYQGFKHEKKLDYHRKCHAESAGEMVCSICQVRHRTMKSLINHMNAHEAVYRCKLCPLVTYYKTSMHNHYQQHKGVKYTCKQCNAVFGSISAFRTHISYRHARSHVCTACGRAYATRVGLRVHLTREHKNEAPLADDAMVVKCDECSLSFVSVEACEKHARVTHKKVIRGRPAGTIVRMRNQNQPRKKPIVTCRVCNAVGSSWGWLSLHVSLEHPTQDLGQLYADKHSYLCDVCGKSFSTVYTLQAHLNVHSGARPYACDACSARFHRALSLQLHRLVHVPPSKPCASCGKKFRSTSNLNNHMRSHIGDRRYKCDICGKGFIHRCSLNEHVRGVHKNIRRVRKRGVTDATERGH